MGPSIRVLREARHTPITVFTTFDDDSDLGGEHDPGPIEVNGQRCPARDGFRTRGVLLKPASVGMLIGAIWHGWLDAGQGVGGRAQLNLTSVGIAVCG
jgi:hypothetical protein